jgi:adenosylcobyric acid synthase
MTARAIMLMGTGSDVGKSLIATGLCRAYNRRGLKVLPFKPQNMSNNAAVTVDGGEIGRAQALQARAACVPPCTDMNPVLLKPETTTGAQVVVRGKRVASMSARDYFNAREQFMPAIIESFHRLARRSDLVIVEGAGSPAETNLRDGDLANMGFAKAADIPAILIGDIHRGGVIASVVGTFQVLDPTDVTRIKGFIINNFHGDIELFRVGEKFTVEKTKVPCLGVVPHFAVAHRLPAEDAVALERDIKSNGGALKIAVLRLPRIANFDDLDPLKLEPSVSIAMVQPGEPIPGDARLVIVPGSKSSIADLKALRREGWDIDIAAHIRRGGYVLGLCGGYQMLGRAVHDPEGLEGPPESVEGLAALDVETTLTGGKTLTSVEALHLASGTPIRAYEIHLGTTTGPDCVRPFARIGDAPDGAVSADGRIMGTYLHGCFVADDFRRSFLSMLGGVPGELRFDETIERTLDELAEHLERHLDLDAILALSRVPGAP